MKYKIYRKLKASSAFIFKAEERKPINIHGLNSNECLDLNFIFY
jgi:hypothetical protein